MTVDNGNDPAIPVELRQHAPVHLHSAVGGGDREHRALLRQQVRCLRLLANSRFFET
jgi:hypothetical protein